jgi:beta-xylosidase
MKKLIIGIYLIIFSLQACKQNTQREETASSQTDSATSAAANSSISNVSFTNPVLPGDFADPSVTKVGDTYWATATSSEWAPLFPLLKSANLIDWEMVGHVFPDNLPKWAEAHFWAPEISYENGKVYIYYVGKKKGGNLCVGVASATNPAGPYTDHGPLVCQEVGSIDGFPIRDENGQLYLIWKEDGNSQNKPTPIWGQKMNEERTKLTGEKFELIRNDVKWEGNLVEGPALFRRGDYFYMIYAGDACCGRNCTYATGVARAKKLTGPWEKYAGNPILEKNDTWTCPGHGTVITDKAGEYYFLYHAYHTEDFVYPGRQGLLDKFTWTTDGWPVFEKKSPSVGNTTLAKENINTEDEFTGDSLSTSWQWPVNNIPQYSEKDAAGGVLQLSAKPGKIGAVLAQRTKTDSYEASTAIHIRSLTSGVQAGLAAIGDQENALGISVGKDKISVWQVKGNKQNVISEVKTPADSIVQLRLTTDDGANFQFAWSNNGQKWNQLQQTKVDGSYLPPWDRGVRVGVVAKGNAAQKASFDWFRLTNK